MSDEPHDHDPPSSSPSSFRLEATTITDLDLIARCYTESTGVRHSRTDALRLAARLEADRLRRKGVGR